MEDNIDSDDPDDSNSKVSEHANTTPIISDTSPNSSVSIILEFIEGGKFIYCCDGYEETETLRTIAWSDSSFNYLIKFPNETVITTTR